MITHATSTYPCEPDELNLRMIQTLRESFPCPIGYSGHEVGLIPSVVAVAMGACMVERHITLDRAMWGSDQAASVEPGGFERLVKYIRVTEAVAGRRGEEGLRQRAVLAQEAAPVPVMAEFPDPRRPGPEAPLGARRATAHPAWGAGGPQAPRQRARARWCFSTPPPASWG